jgi:adenylate kinase family enzyme
MASIKNIISFYRSCYQHDLRSVSIPHMLSSKVKHLQVLDTFEILTSRHGKVPVDTVWASEADTHLQLHSSEEVLYLCALFVKGRIKVLGKEKKALIPLVIYDVDLDLDNDVYFLEPDLGNPLVNPAFLSFFKGEGRGENLSQEDFSGWFPTGRWDFENLISLHKKLLTDFPQLDVECMEEIIRDRAPETELEKIHRSKASSWDRKLIPALALGVFDRAKGSRGILKELDILRASNELSIPLTQLFHPSPQKTTTTSTSKIISPVALSKAQQAVLHSADQYPLSLVIGPPGTGKSFTIAALAADYISKGKSVLIASKNNQAGRVVAHKIEADFGLKGIVVKTGRSSYRQILLRRFNDILSGFLVSGIPAKQLEEAESDLKRKERDIQKLETTLSKQVKQEVYWGRILSKSNPNLVDRFRLYFIRNKKASAPRMWEMKKELDKKRRRYYRAARTYILLRHNHFLYRKLATHRKDLVSMTKALSQDTGNLIQHYFDRINFKIILDGMPVWICNASDIHNILPLVPNLFDVVVIDEATQCDVASSIPLLQRGKKAVIVGDPKQLRHLSFLSVKHQEKLGAENQLSPYEVNQYDYRKKSILDLVLDVIPGQDQLAFLNEHYRSMPAIIRFSNRRFYSDSLKVMTSTPSNQQQMAVNLYQVNGTRDESGKNLAEAEIIVEKLQQLIESESGLTASMCQSVGILSPFRLQVSLLRTLVRKTLDAHQIRRHRILVGTPYHFQGEERDVMFLSFAVDDQTHPSTFIYLNREDVFNVSITRARAAQHVFSSIQPDRLKAESIFGQYLSENRSPKSVDTIHPAHEQQDEFALEVVQVIKGWGIDFVRQSYCIAGIDLDLVVVREGRTYSIDLIGYPGETQAMYDHEHINMMQRIDVPVFAISYSSWVLQRKTAQKKLKQFLFEEG